MTLLGSTKIKIAKDKNDENIPYLDITEVVVTHGNIDNNNCLQDSRVLHTFVSNKSFGKLLDILLKHFVF